MKSRPRSIGRELNDPSLKSSHGDLANLQAECLERSANLVLQGDTACQERLPVRQQQAEFLALGSLDVDRSEPPHAHCLRDSARIVSVGLYRHRRRCTLHSACLDANRWQAGSVEPIGKPGRKRSSLQSNSLVGHADRLQPGGDSFGIGNGFTFAQNRAGIVNDTHGCITKRHVEANEVFHRILQVVCAADCLGDAKPSRPKPQSPDLYHAGEPSTATPTRCAASERRERTAGLTGITI